MRVQTCLTPLNIAADALEGATAVVIDTLRMTSTAVTAIANGCEGIKPFTEEEEARRFAAQMPGALLCGERFGRIQEGFDLGNSPLEYTVERVSGKKLISTTTNGTRVLNLATPANRVLIGALLNAKAIAKALQGVDKLALLTAGTYDKFSMEDVVTGGCILHHLREMGVALALDDASIAATWLFEHARKDLFGVISQTAHSNFLLNIGPEAVEDLRYCLRQDVLEVVPELRDGWIVR